MEHLVTLVLPLLVIAAVFGIVYSDKRIYDAVEVILTRVFEKFDYPCNFIVYNAIDKWMHCLWPDRKYIHIALICPI